MSEHWTSDRIDDLTGKTVIVTGANSGLGFETASALAGKGAEVILAVRNLEKGATAVNKIKSTHPKAHVTVMELDLSQISNIQIFAHEFLSQYKSLSLLVNNAGVMIPPYQQTKDGFELQFGCNHLGHFALTGLLMPRLISTPRSRVVTLSSIASYKGKIDFNNLDGKRGYKPMVFYRQSKLANLLFARELQKQFDRHHIDSMSVACHPGLAHTNLASRGSGKPANKVFQFISKVITQPADMGALPTLYAATEPSLQGGEFIGPDGKGGRKGYPKSDTIIEDLYDSEISKKLWKVSESLTGVTYPFEL